MGRACICRAGRGVLAAVLAVCLSVATMPVVSVFAEGTKPISAVASMTVSDSYQAYIESLTESRRGEDTIRLDGEAGQPLKGTVSCKEAVTYEGGAALLTQDDSMVQWSFTVKTAGLYTVSFVLDSASARGVAAQRSLYIDGRTPFDECEAITFRRVWRDILTDGTFRQDYVGNQLRPEVEEINTVYTEVFKSTSGTAYEIYLAAGEHTLALEAAKEQLIVDTIRLQPRSEMLSYNQVAAGYTAQAVEQQEPILLEAESPSAKSDSSIYPSNDRASAITSPQSASALLLNTVGGSSWQTAGQWIQWDIHVPQTGLYYLAVRYRQDGLQGVAVTRSLSIDGQIPFAEAATLTFPYTTTWQTQVISDKKGVPYVFELKQGTHQLRLEVVLGETAAIIDRVSASLDELNALYREILSVTGPSPDEHRDYDFPTLIPEVLAGLAEQSAALKKAAAELEVFCGEQGEMYALLHRVYYQIDKITSKPDKLAQLFDAFKSNLGTLGDWIYSMSNQPMEIDCFWLAGDTQTIPQSKESFWEKLSFNTSLFINSFIIDYSVVSGVGESGDPLTVWVSSGRDQAQILNTLVSNNSSFDFAVEVNLVSAATLLPATLSGDGPDVSLGMGGTTTIDFAIRNAVVDLTQFDDLEEVLSRFTKSAVTPLRYRSAVYGLPETHVFPMMFVRTDVMEEKGLSAPATWTELRNMLPALQRDSMTVGILQGYAGFLNLLYQHGGSLYAANGVHTGLDTNASMAAFEELCELFTLYDLPISYNAANRFRSGEMPLVITDYTFYNTLVVFAPEITGLWEMVPIPGTQNGDTLDYSAVSATTAAILLKTDREEEGWAFLKWWTDAEVQAAYCADMEAILGPSAKQATATIEALERLSWTVNEYKNLADQQKQTVSVETVPGYYQAQRLVGFAFNDVYNNNSDPVRQLEKTIISINQELERKAEEFRRNQQNRR